MSFHLDAKPGEISPKVLLPGDPNRAEKMANTFLKDPRFYNKKRLAYGLTGEFDGQPISIQTSGMGLPSLGIYLNELIESYDCNQFIRIGTCGSLQTDLVPGDIVVAQAASTDSGINKRIFNQLDFAPVADGELLLSATAKLQAKQKNFRLGSVLSTDTFYNPVAHEREIWSRYGVLAVDMESSYLYTRCAQKGLAALTLLVVSDSIVTGHSLDPSLYWSALTEITQIALEVLTDPALPAPRS
jgi:purine-nucleoside phosphorylase